MAGYENLGPGPAAKTSHQACREDGKILAWPTGGREVLESWVGLQYMQSADITDTLRFTKTKGLPCATTFLDGCGMTHSVKVFPDDKITIIIPLPDETFKRHLNTYKQIVWMFDNGGTPTEERTCTPPSCSLAECTFTYQRSSTLHNHGIHIRIQAYSLDEKCCFETKHPEEQAFWEAVKQGESLQGHTIEAKDLEALSPKSGSDSSPIKDLIWSVSSSVSQRATGLLHLGSGISKKVEAAFQSADLDGDGRISRSELSKFVEGHPELWEMLKVSTGLDETFCKNLVTDIILKKSDKNIDGKLSLKEFSSMHTALLKKSENQLELFHEVLFAAFDADGNGLLNVDELDNLLDIFYDKSSIFAGDGRLPPKEDLRARVLCELDANKDGQLSFAELKPLLTGSFLLS